MGQLTLRSSRLKKKDVKPYEIGSLRIACQSSTVDRDGGASDEGCLVTAKPCREKRTLFRRTNSTHRNGLFDLRLVLQLSNPVVKNRTWRDRVDSDIHLCIIKGCTFRQAYDAMLCGRIVG